MTKFKGYAISGFSGSRCSANAQGVGHPSEKMRYTLVSIGRSNDVYLCQCECGDSRRMYTYAKRKKR